MNNQPPQKKQKKEDDPPRRRPASSVIGVTRSISACQRCRTRKTRCDQKFPSCTACLRAKVECVGIDAATGREIPRSYVSHLEDRVALLESHLQSFGLDIDSLSHQNVGKVASSGALVPAGGGGSGGSGSGAGSVASSSGRNGSTGAATASSDGPEPKAEEDDVNTDSTTAPASAVHNVIREVPMVPETTPSSSAKQSTFLGQSSGLSFARILMTAVRMRNHDMVSSSERTSVSGNTNGQRHGSGSGGENSASSSKAVDTPKPKPKPAVLPPKETAESYLAAYFSQANPQLPVLHREDFLHKYFEPIYGKLSSKVSLASDYTSMASEVSDDRDPDCYYYKYCHNATDEERERLALGEPRPELYFLNIVFGIATSIHQQQYPAHISESYRLTAMHHCDAVFTAPNRLESLQGILLSALYSVMRPAVPGVWYVLGSALRLCVDLGLHYEGSVRSRVSTSNGLHGGSNFNGSANFDPLTRDMRRRLFWCTFALDRQVCVYLGRPFGIPDESVKVPFPSELDDAMITKERLGTVTDFSKETSTSPSYKTVALSFFRIRLIQSEIQRVLYDCADVPRKYKSLEEWKHDMARKLEEWHHQCPKSTRKMNCNFNIAFFELNYHQTRLLLYGLSPGNTGPTVESYLIIADAGEKIIKKYHELHRKRVINYTWVAVHNLFMSGTSYLYALYHSPEVRANTTLEEIDFNTLACIHVLSSMSDCCDAAVGCRDSFELLTAAIMKLCYNERAGIVMQPLKNVNTITSASGSTAGPGQDGVHLVNQPTSPSDSFSATSPGHSQNFPSGLRAGMTMTRAGYHGVRNNRYIKKEVSSSGEGIAASAGLAPQQPQQHQSQHHHPQQQQQQQPQSDSQQQQQLMAPDEVGPMPWPMPDDLELFFQEAAQLEGISPDSIRTGGASNSPEAASWYGDSTEGPGGVLIDNNRHNVGGRHDQQRIYDIINGVPLAPIWDQFFAPHHVTTPPAPDTTNMEDDKPYSDIFSSRWQ